MILHKRTVKGHTAKIRALHAYASIYVSHVFRQKNSTQGAEQHQQQHHRDGTFSEDRLGAVIVCII